MSSWILFFYSLQIIITIWKEQHEKDEYTPFVTPKNGVYSFHTITHSFDAIKEIAPETNHPIPTPEKEGNSFVWKYSLYLFCYVVINQSKQQPIT